MGDIGLEQMLDCIPECFQDIVYSSFFPSQLYAPLEIKAIHWQELRTQKCHKNHERRTGGPSYRHVKEVVQTMFELASGLSKDHDIFKEIYGEDAEEVEIR